MINKENGIEYEVIEAKKKSDVNLVFVHGTGCNKKFLRAIAELFEDYNCYLMDLPGHGNSDHTGYTIDNYIKAIKYMAEKLSNVVLVGHSLGGTLVAKTASLNLKSVIGAVILNSGASYPDLTGNIYKGAHEGKLNMEAFLDICGHADNEDVLAAFKSMEPNGINIIDLLIDQVIDVSDDMKNIKIPTLIIGGAAEVLVVPENVERLHSLIKTSELIMLPEGRHMICIKEKHKTKQLICDFIKKNFLKNK
ncbi:Pimeloyl-ACP methyl ester carboxylesterase [Clostridium sp. DSM 8431]|uniref:alpha/beta fold hydrolase n=1 Tax=Clostridium sp. DSM 8431 TaxID=1761781 RepID=UPI0008F24D61|nr:alpha/beta hydrolase [Clostridium sp. DSM 8431]SFU55817.1 Pimeloyl-ACP methyl ester carboxylesterase [Clostridium sp. DSM 8431]